MKYKINIGNIKYFEVSLIGIQQFEWTLTLYSRMVMEDSCKLIAIPLNNRSFLGRLKREKGNVKWLGSIGWKRFTIIETCTDKLNAGRIFRPISQFIPLDTIIYKTKNILYINRVLYCIFYNNLLSWQIDLMSLMLKIEKLRVSKVKLFAWDNKVLMIYILIHSWSYREQPSYIYICIVGKSVNH